MAEKSAFATGFGGAMGCFFGLLVAIGLTIGGCVMMMGSCSKEVNKAIEDARDDARKIQEQKSKQPAKPSATDKKSSVLKSQKTSPKKTEDE